MYKGFFSTNHIPKIGRTDVPCFAPTGTERAAWEVDFFTPTETATTVAAELYFPSEEVDEQLLS